MTHKTPKTFTDDDLKQLKEWWQQKGPGSACDCMHYGTAQALLARLELAEFIANKVIVDHPNLPMVERWRKAAGK